MTVMSIRAKYAELGPTAYYRDHGSTYRNPHEPIIRRAIPIAVERWALDLANVLDFACGSGEATLILRAIGAASVDGVDPYTGVAYLARTGQATQPFTFDDVAAGALAGRRYSLIVCSFALHLVEESRLPLLAHQLATISSSLLVLSPNKHPEVITHWPLHEEFVYERVHIRHHRSEHA